MNLNLKFRFSKYIQRICKQKENRYTYKTNVLRRLNGSDEARADYQEEFETFPTCKI